MYKHRHLPGYTCEIIEATTRGFKVKQTEPKGKKSITKTAFYDKIDFDEDKGLWVKIN